MSSWVYKKCKILSWGKVFEVVFLWSYQIKALYSNLRFYRSLSSNLNEKKDHIFNFNLYVKFNVLFIYECKSQITTVLKGLMTLSWVEIPDILISYSNCSRYHNMQKFYCINKICITLPQIWFLVFDKNISIEFISSLILCTYFILYIEH